MLTCHKDLAKIHIIFLKRFLFSEKSKGNYSLLDLNVPLSPDEQQGSLFRHIFCWLNNGALDMKTDEQLVEPDILLTFRFMRMQIDIDIEKYEKSLKRTNNTI